MRIAFNKFFSPKAVAIGTAVLLVPLYGSPNIVAWASCLFALPIALYLIGGSKAPPALIWILAMVWIAIVGDVLVADMSGRRLLEDGNAQFAFKAILYSLAALLAMAWGMLRGDLWAKARTRRPPDDKSFATAKDQDGISLNRALIGYAASFGVAAVGTFLSNAVPSLTQAFIALSFIKWVFIYIIAAKTIESGKGYQWLLLIALFEVATGLISFFSDYKESIFVMLLALASTRRKVPLAYCITAVIATVLVIWMSLIWSAVKTEYRGIVFQLTTEQKINWIAQRYLNQDIDYQAASLLLVSRIGYTNFFAQILAREDAKILPASDSYYLGAIEHVVTPRVLFPNKPVLNDSEITRRLLGLNINAQTSIGIGYVPQAYLDFGFPLMLVPLWGIGCLLGAAGRYFLTRPVPRLVRYAFATTTLFNLFPYAGNIDKEFGGFVINFIEMSLILKIGYPMFEAWLAGRRRMPAQALSGAPAL